MLIHEKGRNLLAVAGIYIAVLMIFLQLGFYSSVPKGALQVYNHLRFDLMNTLCFHDKNSRERDSGSIQIRWQDDLCYFLRIRRQERPPRLFRSQGLSRSLCTGVVCERATQRGGA